MNILDKHRVMGYVKNLLKFNADNTASESLSRSSEQLPKICNSPTCDSSELKDEKTQLQNNQLHINFGSKKINGLPISHVVSLGSHCLTASILKKYGLKKASFPFDWIFSSPEVVIDCLNDEFELFLDKRQHKFVTGNRVNGSSEPGATHIYFQEHYGTKEFFTHRDTTIEENYNYYSRAVSRFKELLKSDEGKLFIIISRGNRDLINNFDALTKALEQKTNNFFLVGVQLLHSRTESFPLFLDEKKNTVNSALYSFSSTSVEEFRDHYPSMTDEMIILSLISDFDIKLI
ncbi:hypothetical protein SGGMMB4_01773 [Sodalis glossinidius str. 'morsitans']|uniref:Papain-like cysteine peptidase (DUF1796) n=2 Tax=Sodalis glossinidius TaxID=63612 RepID=Q2NUY5_SODGM|nr:DUF1796 family putative cysteine peptidase [Sodalis glossinidius]BAE74040.1 hypothetical protein SG0765 [Sodalis glossinidius str. 'morsitans']CRL44593.1 hypothetical protein SGGMMB4_01773 [Sodalis glossinidius str. 'morsitans']